jgi:hypothetical protein
VSAPLPPEERASFRAVAEANRTEADGTESQWASYTLRLLDDVEQAEARLAAVRVIHHFRRGHTPVIGSLLCEACREPWPCPTFRAAEGKP